MSRHCRSLTSGAGGSETERLSGASRPLERAADAASSKATSSSLDHILRSHTQLGEKIFESDEDDESVQTRPSAATASSALSAAALCSSLAGHLEMSRMFPTPPSFDSHLIPSPGDSAATAIAQSSSSTLLSPPGSVPPPAAAVASAGISCSYGNPLTPASSQQSSDTLYGSSPLPAALNLNPNALSPAFSTGSGGGFGAQLVPCDATRRALVAASSSFANPYVELSTGGGVRSGAASVSFTFASGSHSRRDACVQATAALQETAADVEAALYEVRRADWTSIFLPAPRLQEGTLFFYTCTVRSVSLVPVLYSN